MLNIHKLHTHYGQIQALKGININIEKGEIVTLIGANGAGKSTLLNTICGEPRLSRGKITYKGTDISQYPQHKIATLGIALVPEGRRIFSGLTIEENLELGGFHQSAQSVKDGIAHVYSLFPRLQERRLQRAGTLSGGEQQMLAIGRGLMSKPDLLLLDEPSLGLAPIVIQQIFDIIESIRDEGITIFLVEQNANKALQIADRGYIMETGSITHTDTGENLLASDAIRSAYLGG
ncbi:MAG: ABC transporter ATP-binding protein [Gammaproteobacteria bacterium]|nr:ABC transporter ATP-binding protein [Gammaproteobacteria bacterium]